MKWFKCEECGLKKRARGAISIMVDFKLLEVTAGTFADDTYVIQAEWEGAKIYQLNEISELPRCRECGQPVEIVEALCPHEWGETQFGYGDAKGQVKRTCTICREQQIGIAQPVWPEQKG